MVLTCRYLQSHFKLSIYYNSLNTLPLTFPRSALAVNLDFTSPASIFELQFYQVVNERKTVHFQFLYEEESNTGLTPQTQKKRCPFKKEAVYH